jgi:hypothetical protein
VPGHAFLSYSHEDVDYARALERHLEANGIVTWYAEEIPHRARWRAVLTEKITTCGAFILLMTPDSEKSVWVEREMNHAETTNRPIYPLLLRGTPFLDVNDIQHEDVRHGGMPSEAFLNELRSALADVPTDADGSGDEAPVSLDSESEEAFQILKHIYGRGTSGATTYRVREFLRRVEGLGTTIAIGRSRRTLDGRSDYVMVRAAGKRLFGAVAYVFPANGALNLRLRAGDLGGLSNPRIIARDRRATDAYGIDCPLVDNEAVDIAVDLTKRALDKIRRTA